MNYTVKEIYSWMLDSDSSPEGLCIIKGRISKSWFITTQPTYYLYTDLLTIEDYFGLLAEGKIE